MESGGGASGDGGCSGGHLCHVCGYKYASAHPSAKQRRAHRKNCGAKPPSAAAAEEVDGKKLLLGEGEGEGGGGGDKSGAGASDCGGGFTRSAQDAEDAVEDERHAERSSLNDAGVQVIINRSTEDCLISRSHVPSEVAPKVDETEIQTEVATQLSENAPYLEDSRPAQPAITCDQHQDASPSPRPSEPEDGARFSSEFSADEISKSSVVSLASNTALGENFAQTNAIVGCPDDISATQEDFQINTIAKDKTSDDMLAKGSEIDSSYQEKLQTKKFEDHSATTVEEDPSVDITVISEDEILGEETESKEQSGLILTSSVEQVSTIKEHVNLPGNKEYCSEKNVYTDDTNGDDLFELGTGGCHLEPTDIKSQQQIDSISVAADQLTILKLTEIEEGQHYPDADGIIQDVSSAIGPAVGAEVISAGSIANLSKNVYSSEMTKGDSTEDNATHTSGTVFMPSQVDLSERSFPTPHEINTVSSKHGVEENRQNDSIRADLTSHAINEVCGINVEEKQLNEDITANTSPHEAITVCSTGDFGENKQNEEIIAEASSHKISIVQGTSNVEEKEHIEEVIANPAFDKIDVTSSKDIVEEKKQSEVHVETAHELNVACNVGNVDEKKQSEETVVDLTCEIPSTVDFEKHNEKTTGDPTTCETNMVNATDNVGEQKQIEEITTQHAPGATNVILSPDDEDKKQNEDMSEGPISHDIIVVHSTDNVKEKNEDNTSDPTSYKIDSVCTTGSVQEKQQNEEITADPTSHRINVVHTVDGVEEKNKERTSDPTSVKIDAESNTDGVEEKRQNEEIAADPNSHANIPQVTDNAEKKQCKEVAADPAPDKIPAARNTGDVEDNKQKEETATGEIKTTQSTNDDQNEEITDKEMTINSDKSHVSLKALLSEKGMETKEKKASTKDRVLSFRRRPSKDSASPAKPGSEQQDWNSPARLPVEKSPKGKKQQWMPFICCPSIN